MFKIVAHGIYAIALGLNGNDAIQSLPLIEEQAPTHILFRSTYICTHVMQE
jgi:hypothetical protein